jgi:hypothetical protein
LSWNFKCDLVFNRTHQAGERTTCPWTEPRLGDVCLSWYTLIFYYGCFVTALNFRVGPHKAGNVKTKIMSFSV